MRGIRFAGAALLLVGAIAAELSVVRTWRLHIAQIPDSYNYTAFTSVCTFFWPSTLAIALIVAGAVNSLRIQPATKGRVVFELFYLVLALYFLIVLYRTMWWAYDPSHSGPAM